MITREVVHEAVQAAVTAAARHQGGRVAYQRWGWRPDDGVFWEQVPPGQYASLLSRRVARRK